MVLSSDEAEVMIKELKSITEYEDFFLENIRIPVKKI